MSTPPYGILSALGVARRGFAALTPIPSTSYFARARIGLARVARAGPSRIMIPGPASQWESLVYELALHMLAARLRFGLLHASAEPGN